MSKSTISLIRRKAVMANLRSLLFYSVVRVILHGDIEKSKNQNQNNN